MGFGYREFLNLQYKKFWRSPNLNKKLLGKILLFVFYSFLFLEIIGLGFAAYFLIKESFPQSDYFIKLNDYIYLFLIISLPILFSVNSFKPALIKPFMLLPVNKRKIILYHLFKDWLHPVLIILVLWVVIVSVTYIYHGFPAKNILFWAISLIFTLFFFNMLAWLNDRVTYMQFVFSFVIIGSIATIKIAPDFFKPLSKFYLNIYQGNLLYFLGLIVIISGSFFLLIRYMENHLYLDEKLRSSKSKAKWELIELNFLKKSGFTGAFIRNDIRMLLRNSRGKRIFIASIIFILFAAFVFYAPMYKNNTFMYVFVSVSVTSVFLINFGSFVPAWDSEYFPLLMSQSIRYRDYLEAKWGLMMISVWILLVLALPLLYFGTEIYKLIIAFAFFNAGITVYLVLLLGLFNTTPMKLNEEVKAFSGGQGFNGKMFLLTLIRLFLPIVFYFLLKHFIGLEKTLMVLILLGISGILLKKYAIDKLSGWYNRRKYIMIESFKTKDE